VQACPHDNVVVATRVPAVELVDPARRSAIGRIIERTDIVALVVVFVFGALLNAAAMIGPVYAARSRAAEALGASDGVVLALMFIAGLVVAPAVLLSGLAATTRTLAGAPLSIASIVRRFTFGLVPFGFGMWLGHYSFHLLTGVLVVVPVTQSAVFDLLGWPALGEPRWLWTGLRAGAVFPIQAGFVLLGALGSMAVTRSIAERDFRERAGRAALPWLVALAALTAVAIWVLFQPMEMRGMGL
jgi:hypothetical protein